MGFSARNSPDGEPHVCAFHQGLKEAGFVEGQNVAIEYRSDEKPMRLPLLAADLVRRQVSLFVAHTRFCSLWRPRPQTRRCRSSYASADDPVRDGLVDSLNRPGGNVPASISLSAELVAKRLEFLREVVPAARRVAVLSQSLQCVEEVKSHRGETQKAAGTHHATANAE